MRLLGAGRRRPTAPEASAASDESNQSSLDLAILQALKERSVPPLSRMVLAFAILWAALNELKLSMPQVQMLMFAYLMYSAQATIYLTRVRGRFWSFAPSRYVAAATIGNIIISSVLAALGVTLAPVPVEYLAVTLGAVIAAAVLLDQVKLWLFQGTETFGTSSPAFSKA